MALDADPLRIDVALRHDRVDGWNDALHRARARVSGFVDDVRLEDDVAIADVAGEVDARADVRPAVAVQALRELLVDVDHHRILLRWIEVVRLDENGAV